MGSLGDHAKNPILGRSLAAVEVDEQFAELIRVIWLSDLELGYGEDLLNEKTKALPKLSLLRICISEYLLKQVYWTHAKKDHRLKLLDIAESVLKKVDNGEVDGTLSGAGSFTNMLPWCDIGRHMQTMETEMVQTKSDMGRSIGCLGRQTGLQKGLRAADDA